MQKEMDYGVYCFTKAEFAAALAQGISLILVVSYLFYRSWAAVPFLSPLLLFYLRKKRTWKKKLRLEHLQMEFREAVLSVSAALKAGYSVENAFGAAYQDMKVLYGEGAAIVLELEILVHKIRMNIILEQALEDFAARSGLEDVKNFTEVFAAAKRSGGDFNAIIQSTAVVISEKAEVRKEIAVMISGKRLEQRVMSIVPFGIMFYIDLTSPGFFEVLYHNPLGIGLMSFCLVIYGLACIMSEKIVEIEV